MTSKKAKTAPARKQTPKKASSIEIAIKCERTSMDDVLSHFDQVTAIHPACEAVPATDAEGRMELVDAIERDGLLDPIKINSKGELLDGRNRLVACYLLGIEPQLETTDADPWAIAVSSVAQRNLTTGQRAAFADERLKHDRQKLGTRQGRAAELAGKEVGVSRYSIGRFAKLPKWLQEEVKAGRTSLNAARLETHGKVTAQETNLKKSAPTQRRSLPNGIEVAYEQGNVIVLRHRESKEQVIIRGPVDGKFLVHLDRANKSAMLPSLEAALNSGASKLAASATQTHQHSSRPASGPTLHLSRQDQPTNTGTMLPSSNRTRTDSQERRRGSGGNQSTPPVSGSTPESTCHRILLEIRLI